MPAYVQNKNNEASYGASSPQTVTLPGTTAGNLIVLVQAGGPAQTFGAPTDGVNTYHACAAASFTDGGNTMNTYYAPNIAGGSVTISSTLGGTASYTAFYAFELSGCNAYDNGGYGSTNGTTNTSDPTTSIFSLSYANEIVIVATIMGDTATGAGTGFTLITITGGYFDVLEYGLFGAGPTTATVIPDGTMQNWGIVAAGFHSTLSPYIILPTDAVFFGMT